MKKLITIALAISMVASLSTAAFASEATNAGAEVNAGAVTNVGENALGIPVKGVCQSASPATETVISADITWGAMECTFSLGTPGEWDPETHSYGAPVGGGWSYNGNEITVTNHSNVEIAAGFAFSEAENLPLVGSFTESVLMLDSAEGTTYEDAPCGTTTFTISDGNIEQSMDLIGVIYVTIGKSAYTPVGTEGELIKAAAGYLAEPALIKLTQDITLNESLVMSDSFARIIDLGGHTLTLASKDEKGGIQVGEKGVLTMANGSVISTGNNHVGIQNFGHLTMDNCTLTTSEAYTLLDVYGTTFIKNCQLTNELPPEEGNLWSPYALCISSAPEVTLEGDITFKGRVRSTFAADVKLLAGTYQYDHDYYREDGSANSGSPHGYARVDEERYTLTYNGNSSWTVTAK